MISKTTYTITGKDAFTKFYRVAFVELEGAFPISKSNKASVFLPPSELSAIGASLLDHIKKEDDMSFAFTILKEGDVFKISKDIKDALNDNAFLCYLDPSPLLPS